MNVSELACYQVELPVFDGEYVMSGGRVIHSLVTTVVRVTAADGTVGYGEACTLGGNYLDGHLGSVQATIAELAPIVFRTGVFDPDVLVTRMDQALIGHLPGKAAIDTALWDLRGKLLGQPVARLIGGVHQTTFETFTAIGHGTPDEMAEKARRYAEYGFRHWQLKLGDDPLEDAERTRAVVEALPSDSSFVTCDANTGWTVAQTLRFLAAIDGIDTYLEQPCRTVPELVRVRARTDLPMMVDEIIKEPADLLTAVRLGLADAVNLKPTRVGGLTKAAKIRDMCVAAGAMVLVDEPMGSDLATGANTHLAASIPERNLISSSFFSHEELPAPYRATHDAAVQHKVRDGWVEWSDAPGLGIDVDDTALGEPIFVQSL